jgi:hypothetical protein
MEGQCGSLAELHDMLYWDLLGTWTTPLHQHLHFCIRLGYHPLDNKYTPKLTTYDDRLQGSPHKRSTPAHYYQPHHALTFHDSLKSTMNHHKFPLFSLHLFYHKRIPPQTRMHTTSLK